MKDLRLADLSTHFLQGMVQEMYRFEANQLDNPNLLTEQEILDCLYAYMGR